MGRHLSPRYGQVILVRWYWSAGTLFWQLSIDHDIDGQSVFSWAPWAPKVARKCENKHWDACGADRRSVGRSVYGQVITKFSRMGSLPHFLPMVLCRGASHARAPLSIGSVSLSFTKWVVSSVGSTPEAILGVVCITLVWISNMSFRILRSRPCPCRYFTHLCVVCYHLS